MATYDTPTTNYSLPKLDGSSDVSDVDEGIGLLADAVDANMAGFASGTLTARAGVTATPGKLYLTTDTGQVFMGIGGVWIEIGVNPWQPGDLKSSWLTGDHGSWLLCDGRNTISQASFPALYAVMGTSAGAGSSGSTFAIPDFRGRVLVAPDGAAGRMPGGDARGEAAGNSILNFSVTAVQSGAGSFVTNTSQIDNRQPYLVAGGVFIRAA